MWPAHASWEHIHLLRNVVPSLAMFTCMVILPGMFHFLYSLQFIQITSSWSQYLWWIFSIVFFCVTLHNVSPWTEYVQKNYLSLQRKAYGSLTFHTIGGPSINSALQTIYTAIEPWVSEVLWDNNVGHIHLLLHIIWWINLGEFTPSYRTYGKRAPKRAGTGYL